MSRGRIRPVQIQSTGVKRTATITAMHFNSFFDGGLHMAARRSATRSLRGRCKQFNYDVPRYKFKGCAPFTNNPPLRS